MTDTKLERRIWAWCLGATLMVLLAGYGLGPVPLERPASSLSAGSIATGSDVDH